MSTQIVNAYIYLSVVVLFHALRKAEGPQGQHHTRDWRKEGIFFFLSLHSILAPLCEMKTQIHTATPPTTVIEEGMDWRTIKSGLCLSRHDISFYLPATAEFSSIFFSLTPGLCPL